MEATAALARPPAQAIAASPPAELQLSPAGKRLAVDDESRRWLLRLAGESGDEATSELRALLLRAARFEVDRRRSQVLQLADGELDAVAQTAADRALTQVLFCLDDYRGASRFTTWAAKFALLETAISLRESAWLQNLSAAHQRSTALSPELVVRLKDAIAALSSDQRHVFEMLIFDAVPIDVLAARLESTRGAVYETLRSARSVLRDHLAARDQL